MKILALAALSASILAQTPAISQTMIEHGAEHRMQLDFRVPDAALAKFLPANWQPTIAASGPAKDANIRLIFIDRVAVTDKDNKLVGKGASSLVYLAVPVNNGAGGKVGQMIIGGLVSSADDAPGPFRNYIAANSTSMQRSISIVDGKTTREETLKFAAPSGEKFEVHVKLEAAPVARTGPTETKFYDSANPDVF